MQKRFGAVLVNGLAAILWLGGAQAQTNKDMRGLLQDTAAASRAAKSWLAEGVQVSEMDSRGIHMHVESRFKVAFQSPSKIFEQTTNIKQIAGGMDVGSAGSGTTVCDGADHWTLFLPGVSFYVSPVGVSACKVEIGDFADIADNLLSATMAGSEHVQFGDGVRECELVRAEYSGPPVTRTLCIEPVQMLILRSRTERRIAAGVVTVETTTFKTYKRNTDIPEFTSVR